jgi:uncharacterized repeat protein (TIGR02543 family)
MNKRRNVYMNTKTTKFLAVLAVLAMAFAGLVVVEQYDADAATTDRVSANYVEVNGLYVHFNESLTATAKGTNVAFIGVVDSGVGTITAYTNGNYAYASISGLGELKSGDAKFISRIVQTNSALEDWKADATITDKAPFVKDQVYNVDFSKKGEATAATAKTDYVFPIPKDGSTVNIKFYSGEVGAYVLEKEINLDFAQVYTKIMLGSADSQSTGYSDTVVSGWKYTNSNTTIAMKNYGGNEIFYKDGNLVVTLAGDNAMGYELADKTVVDVVGGLDVIYATGTLTIGPAESAKASLAIKVDLGNEAVVSKWNTGGAGAIHAKGNLTISGLESLDIAVVGTWVGETETYVNGVYGIHGEATGDSAIVIGTATMPQAVDITVTPKCPASNAIVNRGGTATFCVTGCIESASSTIYGSSETTTKFVNCGTEYEPLTIVGAEKGIQTKKAPTETEITSSFISVQISDERAYNWGDDFVAGISVQKLKVTDSVVWTDGLIFDGDGAPSPTSTMTLASESVVYVSGDYEQNPNTKKTPAISGLWVEMNNATTIEAYSETPVEPPVAGYILLVDNADSAGNVKVMDSKGREQKITYTDLTKLTTTELENTYAKEIMFKSTGAASTQDKIVVPEDKTLILQISGTALSGKGETGTVIQCGDVSFKLASGKGFIGTVAISALGISIDGATNLDLSDVVGDVVITGTISAASASIAAKEGVDSNVIFGKATISKAIAITDMDVTIPKNVTVTIDDGISIAKSKGAPKMTIDGKAAIGTNGKISMGEGTSLLVTATGVVTGVSASTVAIELADKGTNGAAATAEIKGVIGYDKSASAESTKYVAIGKGGKYVSGTNVTGFTVTGAPSDGGNPSITPAVSTANAYYAAVNFVVVKSSALTIGEDVIATANGLAVEGSLVINGKMISSAAANLTIGTTEKAGSITVNGMLRAGATDADSAAKITVAGAELDFSETADGLYFKGIAISTLEKENKFYPKLTGKLDRYVPAALVGTAAANATLTLTVANNSTVYTADDFAIAKKVKISLTGDNANPAKLIGKIAAPGNNVAQFNVKAGAVNTTLDIIGGSLTISGAMKNGTAMTTSIDILSGTGIILNGITLNDATIVLENGVEAELKGTTTLTANSGTLTVTDGAAMSIDSTTTDAITNGTQIIVKGSVEAANTTVINSLGLKAGCVYEAEGYVYEVFDSTVTGVADYSFVVGVKSYEYTGAPQLTDGKIATKIEKLTGTGDVKFSGTGTLKPQTYEAVREYVDAFTTNVDIGGTIKTISVSVYIKPFDFEVTFDPNGGAFPGSVDPTKTFTYSVSDKTTTFATIKAFPAVTKNGYVFDGWEKAGQADVFLTEDMTIFEASNSFKKDSQTVRSAWMDIKDTYYTIKFDSNGGKSVYDQTVKYAGKVDESLTDTEKDGYVFDGWYVDAKFSSKYNFKSAVTADMTLYAKWDTAEPTATSVDIAVSKTADGVKVTLAGEGDLKVPAGTITVTYYYLIDVGGEKVWDYDEKEQAAVTGKVVSINSISLSKTPVYCIVDFVSEDGSVTATSPIIMYM